jgi:hypothetical protein
MIIDMHSLLNICMLFAPVDLAIVILVFLGCCIGSGFIPLSIPMSFCICFSFHCYCLLKVSPRLLIQLYALCISTYACIIKGEVPYKLNVASRRIALSLVAGIALQAFALGKNKPHRGKPLSRYAITGQGMKPHFPQFS